MIPSEEEEPPASRGLVGTTLGGRYRIRGILGEGGMGTVYEAEHLALGRLVAIKVLHPGQAKRDVAVIRFQKEARAAGTIGHPNICEVYDIGELDDGSPFLVMERLVGETLADRIGRESSLPVEDVVDVMMQVLSGLHAAHEKGILHRDIKPENIFLNKRVGVGPLAKLLDFGVAKEMGKMPADGSDLTLAGMVMGTPFYLSPEQARGERDLDQRTDLYACGVVLYEALAGVRPFAHGSYNALLRAILVGAPRPLREIRPDLPEGFDQLVARTMARDRDARFRNAVELQDALAAYHVANRGFVRPVSSRPESAPNVEPLDFSEPRDTRENRENPWDDRTLLDPSLSQQFRRASYPPEPPSLDDLTFDEETVRTTAPSELAREMREQIRRSKK